MPQDSQKPDSSPEESILQQAKEAIRAENFAQARDILTKLLQTNQQNPEYWVWMSAAMETPKERLYCLQTAFRLDPTNVAARRGLTLMNALDSPDPLPPFPLNHPRPWESKERLNETETRPKITSNPAFRLAAMMGLISLILIGTVIGVLAFAKRPAAATRAPQGTSRPTVTPYPTKIVLAPTQVSTLRPLAAQLAATYTPTAIYVATPHGEAASDSYKAAMRAYQEGQWGTVGIMMAQVATAQPGSVDALYYIGEANRLSGKFAEALDNYKTAIILNPKFAPSYLGRARANLALNPRKNVIDDLNKAVEADPFYAEALLERGLYFLGKNDLTSARADLEQAARLNDSPLVEINLARILLAQQENAAAVTAAERANQMDITMLDSYLVLGMAYRANGQIDQAVDVLGTYLKYQPDNAEAFAILGAAYYNRADYTKAKENLLQSLRLNNNNVDGYYWLGQTYLALKENDLALGNFEKARSAKPDSFDISEGLAKAYMAKGEYKNSYMVILKVEKSVVSPAQRAHFLYIRAISLDQIDQRDAASRDWSEILALPPEATTEEMLRQASQRMAELNTTTPTPILTPGAILPTPTATPTATTTATPAAILPPGSITPTRTPLPTDTRVPTNTPRP